MYSYGYLLMPQPDDPRFETEEEAVRAAEETSATREVTLYGVWRDDDGELLHIVYHGDLYSYAG